MSSIVAQFVKRMILPVALLWVGMVLLGLLVTRVFAHQWPFTLERAANEELAAERTADLNGISLFFSTLANTEIIVLVTAFVALVLWAVLRRWRAPLFLIAAVSAQALVFLCTTLVVERNRPSVEKMDVSPPTSSFPSGHTSAAVALYGGIALLLAVQARHVWSKATIWTLLLAVPVGVAFMRMYRGMHHPTDVIASFINAGTCLFIMARAILDPNVRWRQNKLPAGAGAPTAAAVAAVGAQRRVSSRTGSSGAATSHGTSTYRTP